MDDSLLKYILNEEALLSMKLCTLKEAFNMFIYVIYLTTRIHFIIFTRLT